MSFLEVLLLSFIEGLTEFLPVSSTGHLILTNAVIKMPPSDFIKAFNVIIQFGAIMAVVYLYHARLKWNPRFYRHVLFAFLPTAVLGFLLKDIVDELMESAAVVAWSLIAGGLVLIFVDSWFHNKPAKELNNKSSLLIGLMQVIAMIPGVSRSAATIVGGQLCGLKREQAAEFSFILAIPTLGAATAYKLWKIRDIVDSSQSFSLLLGIFLSFVFAVMAIKFFVSFVNRFGFKYFGVYRIVLGFAVLFLLHKGII